MKPVIRKASPNAGRCNFGAHAHATFARCPTPLLPPLRPLRIAVDELPVIRVQPDGTSPIRRPRPASSMPPHSSASSANRVFAANVRRKFISFGLQRSCTIRSPVSGTAHFGGISSGSPLRKATGQCDEAPCSIGSAAPSKALHTCRPVKPRHDGIGSKFAAGGWAHRLPGIPSCSPPAKDKPQRSASAGRCTAVLEYT